MVQKVAKSVTIYFVYTMVQKVAKSVTFYFSSTKVQDELVDYSVRPPSQILGEDAPAYLDGYFEPLSCKIN